MGKKRDLSIFDAIEELDTQDRKAERKRRKETTGERKRALEAQSQTKIYNHLLEARILLQRAVNKVNDGSKWGKNDSLSQDSSSSSRNALFRETCDTLLAKLLRARSQLLGTSESDSNDGYGDLLRPSSTGDLHGSLQEEYEKHREDWKRILNKKHKSLRLHSGVTAKSQFRIMDSSFWEQVEATTEYEEIRQNDERSRKSVLFDDSKVYQQLLKDFVASSASSAAAGGGASSAELASSSKHANSNTSKKKDVDRRASKGRKIRYKEIPKLVNFTFPLSRPNTSSLNTEEYFQSLFGGVGASSN